jgi:hypothetical protein
VLSIQHTRLFFLSPKARTNQVSLQPKRKHHAQASKQAIIHNAPTVNEISLSLCLSLITVLVLVLLHASGIVTRELHSDGTIDTGSDLFDLESISSRGIYQGVDGVLLLDLFHKGIDGHALLPELQVGYQLVRLSVVTKGNVVIVGLRNDNVGQDGLSLVSTSLNLLTGIVVRLLDILDTQVGQRLQQGLLVVKFGVDASEMTVQGRSSSRTTNSRTVVARSGSKGITTAAAGKDSNQGGNKRGLHDVIQSR